MDKVSKEELPALKRAREFLHQGSIMNAREEWYDLMNQGSAEQLNRAAIAASNWGWHEGTIRAFGKSRYFDDLKRRFPAGPRRPVRKRGPPQQG